MKPLHLDLVQRIQHDYSGNKYKNGELVFQVLREDTIVSMLKSFISWAEENGLTKDDKVDISSIRKLF